eukprot:scaffold50099_cov32-Tisochrysis_lutea.AAC.6
MGIIERFRSKGARDASRTPRGAARASPMGQSPIKVAKGEEGVGGRRIAWGACPRFELKLWFPIFLLSLPNPTVSTFECRHDNLHRNNTRMHVVAVAL